MGIQPIDLQTLYAQLENMSKTVAHQQLGTKLAHDIQQETQAKQAAEKNTAVQQLKKKDEAIPAVHDRENPASGGFQQEKKRHRQDEPDSEPQDDTVYFKDPHLGQIIDISG